MKKISIVAACYNESSNLINLHQRVTKTMSTIPQYDYELILVDNASTDSSAAIYQSLVHQDAHVAVICMSRNFGSSQPSFLAGLHHAQGDAVVMFDGDLQDPPELIPDLVKKWEEGFDVVYCTRVKRSENILRKIGYRCFYRLFRFLSYLDIPLNSGDNSLLDRKVVDVIKALPEKDIYLRGLRTWAGFKQIGIDYIRDPRAGGKTSNSFFANFYWAKKAIVNFSFKPLEYISRLAACAVFATIGAAGLFLYWHFTYGAPKGFSTLLMVMFIFNALQLLALAIIGEYLIRIFQEVKGRPPYVVREILRQEDVSIQSRNEWIPVPSSTRGQDDPAVARGYGGHGKKSSSPVTHEQREKSC